MPRRASESSPRFYFTKDTEDWIVKYNACSDPEEKNRIFSAHLYFPFYKLAECVIHTFKYYYADVQQIEDLKCDVIAMLILDDKLRGFDPSNGAKAFSYFGTIVKRWLIAKNRVDYNKRKQKVSVDVCESTYYEDMEPVETDAAVTLSQFFNTWVKDVSSRVNDLFSSDQDRQVANAILIVFSSRNKLQLFKKKAIYSYVREITGYDTPYLTKVLNILKKDYQRSLKGIQEDLVDSIFDSE